MNQPLCPTELQISSNKKVSRQDIITRKNKTIKKRRHQRKETEDNKKYSNMQAIIESMNNHDDSDDESTLEDYKPLLPPPTLQHQTTKLEAPQHYNANVVEHPDQDKKTDSDDSVVSRDGFTMLEGNNSDLGYNNYVPYYTNAADTQSLDGPKDKLLEKLNYMIHLLEEQKEEKTGHVTEELILYSFLGVFVIFIVDSFARVGKYVR